MADQTRKPLDRPSVRFRYQRLPTSLMPEPIIPERVILPLPGIHDVFRLEVAVAEAVQQDAFSVRWEVYCRELGYEPAERFPDHRERDEADNHSVQVVAYHRGAERPVGCFRLLMADPAQPVTPFHLEEVCSQIADGKLPREPERRMGLAEISRFCILGSFRHFDINQEAPPWGIDPVRWQAEAVHRRGLAGLMWLAAARLTVSMRLDYLLALMEPRLQMLARTLGFSFEEIGPGVEFRGLRVPYRIDRRALRALLSAPRTAGFLEPVAGALEEQARRHVFLQGYYRERTEIISR